MVQITDIYSLKAKLDNLKIRLGQEPRPYNEKELAEKYLSEVFFLVDQLTL